MFHEDVGTGKPIKIRNVGVGARRKVTAAKTLEALRSKLTSKTAEEASEKQAEVEADGLQKEDDAALLERMFCTGHAGKLWLAFAHPQTRL